MSRPTMKRDPENRSRKWCFCGGHSANDHKKCKHHHSTWRRLTFRMNRRLKKHLREAAQQ